MILKKDLMNYTQNERNTVFIIKYLSIVKVYSESSEMNISKMKISLGIPKYVLKI